LFDAIFAAGGDAVAFATAIADETRTGAGRALYGPDDIHGRLSGIAPGPTTLCVIPFAGDYADEGFLKRLSGNAMDLDVVCRTIDIKPQPSVQAVVVEVPAAKRVPR